jgi:hypothetical protein
MARAGPRVAAASGDGPSAAAASSSRAPACIATPKPRINAARSSPVLPSPSPSPSPAARAAARATYHINTSNSQVMTPASPTFSAGGGGKSAGISVMAPVLHLFDHKYLAQGATGSMKIFTIGDQEKYVFGASARSAQRHITPAAQRNDGGIL